MNRNPIWLLGPNGRTVRLQHEAGWHFKEALHPLMVFIPERHEIDLARYDQAEVIAPYHFKGRPVLIHLLGVVIGMLTASIMNLEPVIASMVVLTFALSTLIFQTDIQSSYRMLRLIPASGPVRFIVLHEEEVADLEKCESPEMVHPKMLEAAMLTERETVRVEITRFGLVAVLCSLTALSLTRLLQSRITSGFIDFSDVLAAATVIAALLAAFFSCVRIFQNAVLLRRL